MANDTSTGAFGALDDRGLSLVSVLAGTASHDRYSSGLLSLLQHGEWETRTWSRALREKAPVISNERVDDLPGALAAPFRHLSVPILLRDQPIGLVLVANRSTGYTDADARRLAAIVEQMAPMLGDRLRRERTLRDLSESEDRFRRAVLASPFPTLIHGRRRRDPAGEQLVVRNHRLPA